MFKRITLLISIVVLMVGILAAQERTDEPMPRPTEGAPRGMRRAGPGMQPGRDRLGFMRLGFFEWFNQLEKAYKQNNKEKVGELIAEMKPRMERIFNTAPTATTAKASAGKKRNSFSAAMAV